MGLGKLIGKIDPTTRLLRKLGGKKVRKTLDSMRWGNLAHQMRKTLGFKPVSNSAASYHYGSAAQGYSLNRSYRSLAELTGTRK